MHTSANTASRRGERAPTVALAAAVFATALFVSATLLFACQPMVAKMIVPLLGGAPGAWIVCSLCFQALVLAGYLHAHLVTRLKLLHQTLVQGVLVASAFFAMPVMVDDTLAAALTRSPDAASVATLVLRTVGLPFFVLSTTSPLLQRWFAELGDEDPYHLYAASNAGSMLALLGYPLLLDTHLAVGGQSRALHAGFGIYTVLVVVCAALVLERRRRVVLDVSPAVAAPAPTPVGWQTRALWLGLAFVPSSLLLGATEYVTTEIASVPLLWVLPLAMYLASFVIAFSRREIVSARVVSRTVLASATLVTLTMFGALRTSLGMPLTAAIHVLFVLVASVACHQALAARRPAAAQLTEFYLLMAVGGVLGGAFNGLLAPVLFDRLLEYPIAIALVCLPLARGVRPNRARLAFAAVVAVVLVGRTRVDQGSRVLFRHRSVFGVLAVGHDAAGNRVLLSGQTVQGSQSESPSARHEPQGAYALAGPVGDVLGPNSVKIETRGAMRVGVLGLGVGALAAHARKGDHWTFFELDPSVVGVASDWFSYLADASARADVRVETGDGRLLLRAGEPGRFDVLVMDVLTSDTVPVHLTTREALEVYRRSLAPSGLLLANVESRHVRIDRVLAALARDAGMVAVQRTAFEARWAVLAREGDEVARLRARGWETLDPGPTEVWTDDFANVLGAIRF